MMLLLNLSILHLCIVKTTTGPIDVGEIIVEQVTKLMIDLEDKDWKDR